ncbi:MAG TPA: M1 family aminopeptidase [Polyangiaceae bacterium]|nr:M1 family aminopeptidase [Polyangiaceae bacterium]
MWKRVLTGAVLTLCCHSEPPPVAPAPPQPPPVEKVSPVDPAGRLLDAVQPVAYGLELSIAPDSPGFGGHVRIDLQIARSVDSILLHARELELTELRLTPTQGDAITPAPPRKIGESGLIALDLERPIGPGPARLDIDFKGTFNPHLRSLYGTRAAGRAYAFTQFEPNYARQAFPCFDEPRFKTPFEITLRVPQGLTAIANTRVTRQAALDGGLTELRFARTEKLPTYLVAFAVGPLDVIDAAPIAASPIRATPLPLRGVAARGRGPEMAFALQETPRLLESLERYFGVPYPYDKLDLIAVPDFASGAMENAGAITFRDTLLLLNYKAPEWQRRRSVSVNAHELAHQWFGNLVTMPWWDDIWLNEGFATWLAGRVVDEVHPEYQQRVTRVADFERAFDTDAKESARQVRQPILSDHDIRNAFDSITYTKGSALLGMFERYLGADAFRAGLRLYLERHRFGNGTSRDLLAALEESSGKPVAAAFSSFLDQPGVPSVTSQLRCEPGAPPKVHLEQRRYVPLGSRLTAGDASWQVPVCLRFAVPAGADATAKPGAKVAAPADVIADRCVLLDSAQADVELEAGLCPRWVLPNAQAAGYYRWTLGDAEHASLLEAGFAELDTSERLSLLFNTEAAARAGQRSFEQLMATTVALGKERDREPIQAALGVLGRLRDGLIGDAELPAYRRLVRDLVAARQKQLGLFPAPREDGETKLLRPVLVSALAFEARDPGLRRELDRFGRAQLGLVKEKRSSRLSSEVIEAALAVAVQEGGAPIIQQISVAIAGSNDGIERNRLLGALGSNLNPELTPAVLDLALSPTLRTNERMLTVLGQIHQPETREVTYAWVERNFDAIVERVGAEVGAQLTAVAGAFCTRDEAERARKFFEPRVDALTGGPRLLRLNLESSELCAAFADAQREGAQKWFAAASGT